MSARPKGLIAFELCSRAKIPPEVGVGARIQFGSESAIQSGRLREGGNLASLKVDGWIWVWVQNADESPLEKIIGAR